MDELSRSSKWVAPDEEDAAPALGGAYAAQGRVDTYAGDGIAGFVNGEAHQARFNHPWGVAVDAHGNLYVADSANHRIRKITPHGMVSSLAGDGTPGCVDGQGGGASFNHPRALALDPAGHLLVVDNGNDRIRKVSLQGHVTTHSGEGVRGFYDGARAYARFSLPNGIAVDAQGHAYVADTTNYRIRKLSPGGTASTLAGDGAAGHADGPGAEARFSSPRAVAVDAQGHVYVAEVGNCRIRKISPDGQVSTLAGNGRGKHADGQAHEASFKEPCGLVVDAKGRVYVADSDNQCIRLISPEGLVSTVAGDGKSPADFADGPALQARFSTPTGLCLAPGGLIYVADSKNHCIRRITL